MSLDTKRSIIFTIVEDPLNPETYVEYPDNIERVKHFRAVNFSHNTTKNGKTCFGKSQ